MTAAATGPKAAPELHTEAVLRVWPRQDGPARALSDGQLLDYRHPSETRSLLLAIAVVVVTVLVALRLNPWLAVAILGAWATLVVTVALQVAQHIANAGEITSTQFAHLHPLVEELRERFAMPRTRVFVVESPVLNAFAYGWREPYVIVLHSALVDALDPLELKSVLAHEMGHIRFGHTRLGVLMGGLHTGGMQLPFPINLVAAARQFVFLWWGRSKELTADRAAVLGCHRPSKTIASLVKITVGPKMYSHVNIADLARQAADVRQGWWRVWAGLSQLSASHPFMVNRIQAVVDFVGGARGDSDLRDPHAFDPPPAASGGPGPAGPAPEPARPAPALRPELVPPPAPAPAPRTEPPSAPLPREALQRDGGVLVPPPPPPRDGGAATHAAPYDVDSPVADAAPRRMAPPLDAPPPPPLPCVVEPPPERPAPSVSAERHPPPDPTAKAAVDRAAATDEPARPPAARLTIRQGRDAGRTLALDGGWVSVGRAPENAVCLDDSAVSRRHCQIGWRDGSYRIEDVGSRSGTLVNGAAVQQAVLHGGERIQIGNTELEFAPGAG